MAENPKSQGWWHTVPGVLTAVAAILTAVSGLIVALHQAGFFDRKQVPSPQRSEKTITAPKEPPPKLSQEPAPPSKQSSSSERTVPSPSAKSEGATSDIAGSGTALGSLNFIWPGGDCWDIYRGNQYVTYHCGAGQQALQAGTYTIKGKHTPIFSPFNIQITDGGIVKVP